MENLVSKRLEETKQIVGRRNGNTTRLVDDAVQRLFKYGEIIFKYPSDELDGYYKHTMDNQFIYEPLYYHRDNNIKNDVMRFLFDSVLQRLVNCRICFREGLEVKQYDRLKIIKHEV